MVALATREGAPRSLSVLLPMRTWIPQHQQQGAHEVPGHGNNRCCSPLQEIPVPVRLVLPWVSLVSCQSQDLRFRAVDLCVKALLTVHPIVLFKGAALASAKWARGCLGRGLAHADGVETSLHVTGSQLSQPQRGRINTYGLCVARTPFSGTRPWEGSSSSET